MPTLPQPQSPGPSPAPHCVELDPQLIVEHGKTAGGDRACCKIASASIVDCVACLEDGLSNFLATITEHDRELALRIIGIVSGAGSKGITNNQLLVRIYRSFSSATVKDLIFRPE
jgi:hypothetical protein